MTTKSNKQELAMANIVEGSRIKKEVNNNKNNNNKHIEIEFRLRYGDLETSSYMDLISVKEIEKAINERLDFEWDGMTDEDIQNFLYTYIAQNGNEAYPVGVAVEETLVKYVDDMQSNMEYINSDEISEREKEDYPLYVGCKNLIDFLKRGKKEHFSYQDLKYDGYNGIFDEVSE